VNLRNVVSRFGATFAAAAGLMNILSALYPAIPERMEILRDLLPMYVIRASQTATVIAGFCLILLADGLRKRKRRALQLTLLLLVTSAVLNLTKGLDFEEAVTVLAVGALLLSGHGTFSVPSRTPVPRHVVRRVITLGLLYYCYVLAGFLVLRRVILPHPTMGSASLEPLRLLLGQPSFHYATAHAEWFARSLVILAGAGALYALAELLRPLVHVRHATSEDVEHVRRLVREYGSDTLSYFALQDGRHYFFDDSGEAVLSYRLWGTVAMVGGEPIGREDRIPPLVSAFLQFAHANGMDPCFVGVSQCHAGDYRRAGLRLLKIGEEAVIDLEDFSVDRLKRKVRRAARHAEDLDIKATRFQADEIPDGVREQLGVISEQWVEAKGGAEQGFSMTLGRIPRPSDRECQVMVAMQGTTVLGYLSFAPAEQSGSWSLDAMRRRPDSPNGLTEFLVIKAAELYGAEGYRTLSLNFASLANSEDDIPSRALDGARRFLWDHLSSVYQLKSLYQFNSKFQPVWRSRYLAYEDILKIPKLAVAIAQSEAPIQVPSISLFRRDAA
jgi:lysylphosphatidylglycerol synthetase-like protein (DUF2156 family)